MVTFGALVNLAEFSLFGGLEKVHAVETRHDLVLDAANNQHRARYLPHVVYCWVKEALDQELEAGYQRHQMVDHMRY